MQQPAAALAYERLVTPHGRVRLVSNDCVFLFERLRAASLLVTCKGHDRGQFGDAALVEMGAELGLWRPLELWYDARRTFNADVRVSERWAAWFHANRAGLASVNILTASRFVHMTVSVAKLLSRTGELIRIYTEQQPFEEAVARSVGAPFALDTPDRSADIDAR
jgi:hypothetical protein